MTKTVCDICGKEMSNARVLDNAENMQFCISSYGRIWDIRTECRENLNKWITIRKSESEDN